MKSRLSQIYIALVIVAGAAVFAHAVATWDSVDAAKFVTFGILALVSSGMKVSLPSIPGTMSMNFVFVLIGISEIGLAETLVIGCLGTVVQSVFSAKVRPRPVQLAFNVSSVACSIQAAWSIHYFHNLRVEIITAATFFLTNTLFIATVIGLTERKNIVVVWRDYFWSFPNYLVGAGAAWVVSASTKFVGWQPALLVLPILFVIYRSHQMYVGRLEEARARAEQEKEHALEIAALHRHTIETLALAIESKDQTTADHLARVETYAVEVGKELGMSSAEMEALRAAALLHDIGKIAVPEYIISKPGKLTHEEFDMMKKHTVVGADIVERIHFPYAVAPMVRGHHERWNGTGYPDGLAGEAIPLGARILAAVDTLDALTSDRQYRRGMPMEDAMKVIESESEKAFDPRIVSILARRAHELPGLVAEGPRIEKLRTDARVERGEAPAAGFEQARNIVNLANAVEGAGRSSEELSYLVDGLMQGRKPADLFASLNQHFTAAFPCEAAVLYERCGELLKPEWFHSGAFEPFVTTGVPVGRGLSGWVAENGKVILNGNPSVEPGYLKNPKAFADLRSALAVPIVCSTGLYGVISLYRREQDAFTRQDLARLSSVALTLASRLECA